MRSALSMPEAAGISLQRGRPMTRSRLKKRRWSGNYAKLTAAERAFQRFEHLLWDDARAGTGENAGRRDENRGKRQKGGYCGRLAVCGFRRSGGSH